MTRMMLNIRDPHRVGEHHSSTEMTARTVFTSVAFAKEEEQIKIASTSSQA